MLDGAELVELDGRHYIVLPEGNWKQSDLLFVELNVSGYNSSDEFSQRLSDAYYDVKYPQED